LALLLRAFFRFSLHPIAAFVLKKPVREATNQRTYMAIDAVADQVVGLRNPLDRRIKLFSIGVVLVNLGANPIIEQIQSLIVVEVLLSPILPPTTFLPS
jgi:hypothetical protein